jgi:hypothetical protein
LNPIDLGLDTAFTNNIGNIGNIVVLDTNIVVEFDVLHNKKPRNNSEVCPLANYSITV